VNSTQLRKIKNRAFQEFLSLAKVPATFEISVKSRSSPESASQPFPELVKEAILIWTATMVSGRNKVYEFITEARFEQSQSLLGMVGKGEQSGAGVLAPLCSPSFNAGDEVAMCHQKHQHMKG